MTRQSELHSDPRTKGSWFELWKGLSQQAAGQNFLTRVVLTYGKKRRAKQNKQRQQKGILSVNCFVLPFFLKCVGQTPRRMLWNKHLFTRNTMEPLSQDLRPVCVLTCPRFLFVFSLCRQPREWPRKEAYSRPGHTPLSAVRAGAGGSSPLVVFDMAKSTQKEGRANINHVYVQNCLALFVRVSPNTPFSLFPLKSPDMSHAGRSAFASHPYGPWYLDTQNNTLKAPVSLYQMCPLQSVTESESFC